MPKTNRITEPGTAATAGKKVTITFAIDEDILNEIRNDAENEGLSVNSKVNRILSKYTLFDKYVERHQPVVITGNNFRFMLENLDEDKILDQFKANMLDLIPGDLIEQRYKLTLPNWIKYIFGGMCLHAGTFQDFSYHRDNEGYLCLVFRHNYSTKYSRVLSVAFSELIEKMFNYHTSATILANGLMLKILERDAADIL